MTALHDLNYHHLRYFWAVARAGSIAKACEELHVAQPTISGQLKELEHALGEALFVRSGRGLAPTPTGRLVLRYCDEIFALGRELQEALAAGSEAGSGTPLAVGITDALPKAVAGRLLEPAFATGARLSVVEGHAEQLFAALAAHDLDVVLADTPCPDGDRRGLHAHQLGDSGVGIFAPPALAGLAEGFPRSLVGVSIMLPTTAAGMRGELDDWLAGLPGQPRLAAEIQDAALLSALATARGACFPGHLVLADELERLHGARLLGICPGLKERYWAVSAERRLTHPAVLAITQGARRLLRPR